jgi:hypothetical protein
MNDGWVVDEMWIDGLCMMYKRWIDGFRMMVE